MMSSTKKVGLLAAISVIVGNAVGSGIFTTTGFLARDIGNPLVIMLMWLLAGGIVLCGVLTYYRLHLKWPESGGEFVYITKGFGPLAGFLSGWASFVFGFGAAIAASAISFGYFLDSAVGSFVGISGATGSSIALLSPHNDDTATSILNPAYTAIVLILIVTYFHSRSISVSGRFQLFLTLIKVAFILVLFAVGVKVIYQDYFSAGMPGHIGYLTNHFLESPDTTVSIKNIALGMVFIMYAYSGWNALNYISEEIENPKKNMFIAMIVSSLIIVVLYVFLNFIYLSSLPISALAAEPIVPVAEKSLRALLGNEISIVFCIMLCVSIVSSISAMVWVGPRVYLKMAEYCNRVPKYLAVKNKDNVPVNAMFSQSAWAIFLCVSGTVENILLLSGLPLLLFSFLAVVTSFKVKFEGEIFVKYVFYRLCSLFFIVCVSVSMIIVAMEKPLISVTSIFILCLGIFIYFFRSFKLIFIRDHNN